MDGEARNRPALHLTINGRPIEVSDLTGGASPATTDLPGIVAAVLTEHTVEYGQSHEACLTIPGDGDRCLLVTIRLRAHWF